MKILEAVTRCSDSVMHRALTFNEYKPAFFLDRDGVVTVEKGYVTSLDELEIFPFVKECIDKIHSAGYLAIIISNQSAVGRGYMPEQELWNINKFLIEKTGVDAIYYCPHWYDANSRKSIYNCKCNCRKPNIGLVEKAISEHKVLLEKSYFIGDRESDILTGKNIGIKTILVKTGYDIGLCSETPDYIFSDLQEALRKLLCGIID